MQTLVTEADLRAVLSLPNRPYADPLIFDGSPYYDLSRQELTSIISVSGTVSATPHIFVDAVDYSTHDGIIDWTIGTLKPDFGTVFTTAYFYSRLSSSAVSTSIFFASNIVTAELGPNFPWGTIGSSSVDQGFDYNQLGKMMQMFVSAREACYTVAAAETSAALKYRRGAVLVDDTKKADDWRSDAVEWNAKYEKYLNLVRPTGQIHHFSFTTPNQINMVFADWGALGIDTGSERDIALDTFNSGGGDVGDTI